MGMPGIRVDGDTGVPAGTGRVGCEYNCLIAGTGRAAKVLYPQVSIKSLALSVPKNGRQYRLSLTDHH
jgi:hypothetical protein